MVDCVSTSFLASSVSCMAMPSQEDQLVKLVNPAKLVNLVLAPSVKLLSQSVPDNQAPLDLSCKTSGCLYKNSVLKQLQDCCTEYCNWIRVIVTMVIIAVEDSSQSILYLLQCIK